MKQFTLFEFPSNLGLREPSRGHEPGVRKLPEWLRQHGFHDRLAPEKVIRIQPPAYTMLLDEETGVRNTDALIQYAKQQAEALSEEIGSSFCLALGGDCSILIGSALALKQRGNFGLLYLDGHHDFMFPSLSQSGGAAGMDLAIVTGHGHPRLSNIGGLSPYIQEENVWCLGNREFDDEYVDPIRATRIHYRDLPAMRREGMKACAESFLEMHDRQKLDGFFIHLDVDVLDDALMPAVDSRTPGGISYEELESLLTPVLAHKGAMGLEITILDPELDPNGIYTRQFVEKFCTCFEAANNQ